MGEGNGWWRPTAALPVVAAAALYGWAHWCFAGPGSPSPAVAVAVGAVLCGAACACYFVRVRGGGALFGALFLAVGLLLTVTTADRAAARAEIAVCVVREVHSRVQGAYGEGAPPAKTVHRLDLDCPGGYPDELKGDGTPPARGAEIEVAHDPRRRVSPELAGSTSPWTPAVWAVLMLGAAGLIAARSTAPATKNGRGPDPNGSEPLPGSSGDRI
ncbi:hypothetical protein [Streptomyces sp. NPDC057939]|uniref:hypothetical protein n=1 Tax=Streptomyces sp. NPDC057939 TaxID=3346284 RepID=UPI0036E508B3